VTAIEFIDGGAALVGGTKDGVLYVPIDIVYEPEFQARFIDGIAKFPIRCHGSTIFSRQGCMLSFLLCSSRSRWVDGLYRCGIDVLPSGTYAVVSQQVGRAHLVAIQDENWGNIMQVYTVEPELQADAVYDANALFVGRNDVVLYGSARGYLFVWEQTSGRILCGLDHGEGAPPFCEMLRQIV